MMMMMGSIVSKNEEVSCRRNEYYDIGRWIVMIILWLCVSFLSWLGPPGWSQHHHQKIRYMNGYLVLWILFVWAHDLWGLDGFCVGLMMYIHREWRATPNSIQPSWIAEDNEAIWLNRNWHAGAIFRFVISIRVTERLLPKMIHNFLWAFWSYWVGTIVLSRERNEDKERRTRS